MTAQREVWEASLNAPYRGPLRQASDRPQLQAQVGMAAQGQNPARNLGSIPHPLCKFALNFTPAHRSDDSASQTCPRPRNTSEDGWSRSCIWPQMKNCPFINRAGIAGSGRTEAKLAPGNEERQLCSRHHPASSLRGCLCDRPPLWAPCPPQAPQG